LGGESLLDFIKRKAGMRFKKAAVQGRFRLGLDEELIILLLKSECDARWLLLDDVVLFVLHERS
jgi:hypothetical protein